MRISYLISIQLLILSIIGNGNTLKAQEMDSSFFFTIQSANDWYDSQTGTFKRNYKLGQEAFQVQLTHEELKKIYHELAEAQFTQFPSEYKIIGEVKTVTTPSFDYSLESNFGGEYKKIFYNDRITSAEMKKEVEPFLSLHRRIWEIIYSHAGVQEIRKSNIQWE